MKPSSDAQCSLAHSSFMGFQSGSRPLVSYGAGNGFRSSTGERMSTFLEMSRGRRCLVLTDIDYSSESLAGAGWQCGADHLVVTGLAAAAFIFFSVAEPTMLGLLSQKTERKQKNLPA